MHRFRRQILISFYHTLVHSAAETLLKNSFATEINYNIKIETRNGIDKIRIYSMFATVVYGVWGLLR